MKLCVCDLDGVLADNTARFARAEQERQAFLQEMDIDPEDADKTPAKLIEKEATNLYWRTVFSPELVPLDTLIEGAIDAMAQLSLKGYEVVILTSRPESMREATMRWLFDQGKWNAKAIIMKAPAFQYVKTVIWKAGMIQTLAALYIADDLIVIDDEQVNIDELHKHGFEDSLKLRCYTSLQEAIEA